MVATAFGLTCTTPAFKILWVDSSARGPWPTIADSLCESQNGVMGELNSQELVTRHLPKRDTLQLWCVGRIFTDTGGTVITING
jgi:hypothetical protein